MVALSPVAESLIVVGAGFALTVFAVLRGSKIAAWWIARHLSPADLDALDRERLGR